MLCLVSSPRDILRSINKKQLNILDPQKVQRPAKHPKELVSVRTFIFFLHNVYHSFCFIEYKNVLLLDHIRKSCYFGNLGMDINWTLITPVETEFSFINIFPRLNLFHCGLQFSTLLSTGGAPDAPTNLVTSDVTHHSFRATWTAPEGPVEQYRVEYMTVSGQPQQVEEMS